MRQSRHDHHLTGIHKALSTMISFILLSLLFLPTVHGSVYNVLPRRASDETRPPSISPQLISFDGDLDYVIEQALARASASSGSPELSDAPSLSPSDSPTSSGSSNSAILDAYKCSNATIGHLEILTFQYRIETALGAKVSSVIGEVEEILLEDIASFTLSCRNESNKYANIVAIDSSVPADTPSSSGKKVSSL
jgi:hypothetical protein